MWRKSPNRGLRVAQTIIRGLREERAVTEDRAFHKLLSEDHVPDTDLTEDRTRTHHHPRTMWRKSPNRGPRVVHTAIRGLCEERALTEDRALHTLPSEDHVEKEP